MRIHHRILGVALLLSSCFAAHAEASDKLVTVLTAAEPQTQLMAMVLTFQAINQGSSAHILLCGPAADMALKDAPASTTTGQKPKDMSPQGLMKIIMEKSDTKVEVCAIYLPNAELDASALLDGITPADPVEMAKKLIADDTRILSF